MIKPKVFLLTLSFISLICFITYLLLPPRPPLSPLSFPSLSSPAAPDRTYLILGFLPYWNLKKLSPASLTSITHLAYFTLHLTEDGEILKLVNRKEEDPGYTNYKRIIANETNYPNLILTFMPEDQTALTSILNSPTTRSRAISSISSKLINSQAAGINIDFEPLGSLPPSLRNNFTLFIRDLNQTLPSSIHLSISIYPSAASRVRIWNLSELTPLTDYFVVMTYDYHLPTDKKAGPNAPLRGAGDIFEHDILKNLAEISKLVPAEKILLGIPFYGYEWETTTSEKYISTTTRGSVASLERIQQLIDENTLELLWDRNSLTPYALRKEDGEIISQIYYESIDSIKLKLDLVKQAGLGGIAIWALGYEGENPLLWQTISSLNTP